MRFFHILAVVVVAIGLPAIAGQATAADGTLVPKEEMLALVSGKTVKAKIRSPQGMISYTAKLYEDGVIETKVDFSAARDKGKWTIEDGLYCAQYKKFRYGKKNCWQFVQTAPGEYLMKGLNGAQDQTVKVGDGNTLIVRSR